MLCIDVVKGLPRVSWGQPEANLLKMPYGYQGSTRGQLKCVGPSNVANATEHYAAAGALVLIIIKPSREDTLENVVRVIF